MKNMTNGYIKSFLFLLAFMSLVSCANKKNIIYYQDIDQLVSEKKLETKLSIDDLLLINVSALDNKAAEPFNLSYVQYSASNPAVMTQRQQQLYLIDKDGYIVFPQLGRIKAAGLTKNDFANMLEEKISKFVKDPIVNIRIMNYKFTVQGEVNRPNTYKIESERVTLPEALAMAGDLTIYGRRDNVLVIRDVNGVMTTHRVDLTTGDFVNSDYYYVKQNDVIYVEPNGTRANASAVGPNISVIISAVTLLTTIIALIIR